MVLEILLIHMQWMSSELYLYHIQTLTQMNHRLKVKPNNKKASSRRKQENILWPWFGGWFPSYDIKSAIHNIKFDKLDFREFKTELFDRYS